MDLEVITKRAENPRGAAPLLFVHGAWHGAWCWENFTDYFSARGYDCWALSLRGHGGSAATPLRFTGPRLHHYLDDIATVARTLPAPPVLLGHSMGGALVQLYLAESAATHPAAAAGLLASMPPSGVLKVTLKVARTKPGTFAAANLTGDLGRLVGTPELVRTLFLSEGVSPDLLHRVAAQVGPESYRAFVDMLALKRPKPARARRVPMLVLGAADDWIFPPRDIEATAAAYATSPVMVDDLAHDVMLDTNWERAAEAVEAWLETLPVSDG